MWCAWNERLLRMLSAEEGISMAYRVEYGPREPKKTSRLWTQPRMQIFTAVFLLIFLLGVRQTWPEGTAKLKEFLLPGKPASTETALQNFVVNLKEGSGIGDAFTTFCQEIIDQAQLPSR